MGSIQTGRVIVKEEFRKENEYTEADIFDNFSHVVDIVKPEICNEFAVEEKTSECFHQIGYGEIADTSDDDKNLNDEKISYTQDTNTQGSRVLNVNNPCEFKINNDNPKQQRSCKDSVYENKINDNHPKQQKSSKINYREGNSRKSTECKKLSTNKIPLLMSMEKKYICDICNRPLHNKQHVLYHAISHKGVKDYICHICDKAFFTNISLSSHLKVHDRMHIKYTCDVCGKWFTQKGNMKRHFLIHEGTKKFSCYICKQTFLHKVSLSYHLSIHSGSRDKNQICSVCGAAFSDKSNLTKHYKKHFTIYQEKNKSNLLRQIRIHRKRKQI